MLTRRQLLERGAAGLGAAMLPGAWPAGQAVAAPSVANRLTRYRDPLPRLTSNAIDARAGGTVELTAMAFEQQLHSELPPTPLFGYARTADRVASYPGPALLVNQDVPVRVGYTNDLPATPPAWLNPGATLLTPGGYDQFAGVKHGDRGEVRILSHMHGGLVASADDGNPAANDQDRRGYGRGETQWVDYPFGQPGTLLWYHDHYLGNTRMNVFAGLAAGCIVTDEPDTFDGANPLGLPMGDYDVALVIQDRRFTPNGELWYPAAPASMGGPWAGEYFGDCMLVNGHVWPHLRVEPAVYRFRILNGCNARILDLDLGGARMYVIGSEGGFLPEGTEPVPIKHLTMAPAERYDLIVDFRRVAGQSIMMKNSRPPAPVSTPAPSLTQVMRIDVAPVARAGAPRSLPAPSPGALAPNERPLENLRALGAPLTGDVPARAFVLNEVGAESSEWFLNINGQRFEEADADVVARDSVEDWVYVNTTADTHPMHTHLVMFQVMGRLPFDVDDYEERYGTDHGAERPPGDPAAELRRFATGPLIPPAPEEMGWKDTVKANPGQMTIVRTKFTLPPGATGPQRYVHHCHIVEHEDNDMMRPFTVV